MRIIDKNTDFYDYLQGIYRDDSLVFDRTDSYILDKSIVCDNLHSSYNESSNDYFLLLQVCNTFWLFLITVTDRNSWMKATNYTVDLVSTWKNYNKDRCMMSLDVISLPWRIIRQYSDYKGFIPGRTKLNKTSLLNNPKDAIDAINNKNYDIEHSFMRHRIYVGADYSNPIEKHIPIIAASGLAGLIDPLDIYLSFEEYFSTEKTASERTESVGITDKEKVENHGFDVKQSFRGSKKRSK